MKSSLSFLAAALAAATTCSAASVKPSKAIRQAEDFCGQWDTEDAGDYLIVS